MEAPSQSPVPVSRALRQLMAEQGLSNRKLAGLTKKVNGRGLAAGYIGGIIRGEDRPSTAALELLGRALDVEPERFAEYRLAGARRLLDEREPPDGVGLERALANLRFLHGAAQQSRDDTGDALAEALSVVDDAERLAEGRASTGRSADTKGRRARAG